MSRPRIAIEDAPHGSFARYEGRVNFPPCRCDLCVSSYIPRRRRIVKGLTKEEREARHGYTSRRRTCDCDSCMSYYRGYEAGRRAEQRAHDKRMDYDESYGGLL